MKLGSINLPKSIFAGCHVKNIFFISKIKQVNIAQSDFTAVKSSIALKQPIICEIVPIMTFKTEITCNLCPGNQPQCLHMLTFSRS